MRAAVWHSPVYGPALIGLLPKGKDKVPATARLSYHLPPGPLRQLLAKGSGPTWAQWAQHLTGALPYGGRWTVEEVPDGTSPQQALQHVRETYAGQVLDSSQG